MHVYTDTHKYIDDDYRVSLDTHFHRVVQCTLEDKHNHKYQGLVFHHSYSSFPHSLENEDKWETVLMHRYMIILDAVV